MSQISKLVEKFLSGQSDTNITYDELVRIVLAHGFTHSGGAGSHKVFTKDGVSEIINLQMGSAGKAVGYQIKQVRGIVKKYSLKVE